MCCASKSRQLQPKEAKRALVSENAFLVLNLRWWLVTTATTSKVVPIYWSGLDEKSAGGTGTSSQFLSIVASDVRARQAATEYLSTFAFVEVVSMEHRETVRVLDHRTTDPRRLSAEPQVVLHVLYNLRLLRKDKHVKKMKIQLHMMRKELKTKTRLAIFEMSWRNLELYTMINITKLKVQQLRILQSNFQF